MLSSSEIRQKFLDFFESKGHTIVASAPIVVKNDPTLMFTNAGMNQFKEYFLGEKELPYRRVADTQKCLRVSGKHNDLEEVGVDTYHHTMFEMLGNWSFGDYFKVEALEWSWELLTEVYKIDKSRLYVSVFKGDEKEGLPQSTIALETWKKYVPEDRIIFGNKKDNFWEMGDTGPCGPCSEIHVDMRSEAERKLVDGASLVNADHPQVIEIWNNVFMQYNRKKDGSLETLPAKHVDTGMGFERLVRCLQGKQSNYDTDIFSGTITATENITNIKYNNTDKKEDIAFRVIADHIRAICFTIADGQLPRNTGAGYVIRRILRRAVRYYFSYLNYKQGLLYQLVPLLAKQFENVFPELKAQESFVQKIVMEEENAFLRTLDKGLKKIDDLVAVSQQTKIINGAAAFELFDTYGFPLDLTALIASENNLAIDMDGYNAAMLVQKEGSRAATKIETEDWIELNEGESKFIGYHQLDCETKILKYRKVTAKSKTQYQIVTEQTTCYAESGGQIGDKGLLNIGENSFEIVDTKKENNLIIHFLENLPTNFDGAVSVHVNKNLRKEITLHHTATHLMHAALQKVLGKHIAQKGSLVNDLQLRFDFSHFEKMTEDQIQEVEKIVNEKIRENIPVVIKEMAKDEAIANGATALFGEKYGDIVRVVTIDPNYSVELCGGCHVGNTGEIGLFKIVHESSVAAGVRRVEAYCGNHAFENIQSKEIQLNSIVNLLKNPKDIKKAIENLQDENTSLKKKLEKFEQDELKQLITQLILRKEVINEINFIGSSVTVTSPDALKKICLDTKQHLTNYVIVVTTIINEKLHIAIGIDETLATLQKYNAGAWIKEKIAPLISGGGGGNAFVATAAGNKLDADIISLIKKIIA